MNRFLLAAVFLLGLALIACGVYLHRAPSTAKPNVLLVVLDTFRADRIGAVRNGVPVTPFLTGLAQRSLNFKNTISPSSWTRPAMASFLTATDVATHRVFRSVENTQDGLYSDLLDDSFETLAEFFAANSYDTWAVQTNLNGSAEFGLAQGFAPDHYNYLGRVPATQATDKALDAVRKARGPFLLYTHYMDTHGPFTAPAEYMAMFGPEPPISPEEKRSLSPEGFIPFLYDRLHVYLGQQAAAPTGDLSPKGVEVLNMRYDACARYLDDQLARLVRTVQSEFPNTIVVVLADHGEELYERTALGHGHSLYQELVHVPLFLQGPGIEAKEVDATASTLALLPTLADILGLPTRPQWQAASLLRGSAPAFSLTKGSTSAEGLFLESVVEGNTKILVDRNKDTVTRYDLATDPGEKNGLRDNDENAQRLKKALDERHAAQASAAASRKGLSGAEASSLSGNAYGNTPAPRDTRTATPMSPETREQLHDLGYLK